MFSDNITLSRLSKLDPLVSAEAIGIVQDLWSQDIKMRVTQGRRTWAEQAALYVKGRTLPGSIVTNARAGSSYHNYGLAIDFCVIRKNGSISYSLTEDSNLDTKADWMQIVAAFKSKGWEWGGDWKTIKDYPHLQKTFGYSVAALKKLSKNGQVTCLNIAT